MNDICWVVGRLVREDELDTIEHTWLLQGVAKTKQEAIAMCRDEFYFIGPVELGVPVPHNNVAWVGCYYPLAEPERGECNE